MLSSIEHCISPALREAIEQKIEHEERTLRALLEREEEAARAVKATALDARYFTRKPLHEYV